MKSLILSLVLIPTLASATDVIPKVGSCPVGYRTSGSYCIKLKNAKEKEIVIKSTSCPVGYRTSKNYCIKLSK